MTIVREIDSTEAVRALSEHRAPRRFLHAVPVVEYRAPRAKSPEIAPMLLMKSPADTVQQRLPRGTSITTALELFRQSNPGDFTARECAEFMLAAGWACRHPVPCTCSKLRKLYWADELMEVSREGAEIVWRFK